MWQDTLLGGGGWVWPMVPPSVFCRAMLCRVMCITRQMGTFHDGIFAGNIWQGRPCCVMYDTSLVSTWDRQDNLPGLTVSRYVHNATGEPRGEAGFGRQA